jgi:hypothetical protein
MGMSVGTGLIVAKEVVLFLEAKGILLPSGEFDDTKLDTIQEDIEFAVGIETILKKHGLAIPERIDKIIQLLPLLAAIAR